LLDTNYSYFSTAETGHSSIEVVL